MTRQEREIEKLCAEGGFSRAEIEGWIEEQKDEKFVEQLQAEAAKRERNRIADEIEETINALPHQPMFHVKYLHLYVRKLRELEE